jgi:hypothetical protein
MRTTYETPTEEEGLVRIAGTENAIRGAERNAHNVWYPPTGQQIHFVTAETAPTIELAEDTPNPRPDVSYLYMEEGITIEQIREIQRQCEDFSMEQNVDELYARYFPNENLVIPSNAADEDIGDIQGFGPLNTPYYRLPAEYQHTGTLGQRGTIRNADGFEEIQLREGVRWARGTPHSITGTSCASLFAAWEDAMNRISYCTERYLEEAEARLVKIFHRDFTAGYNIADGTAEFTITIEFDVFGIVF